MIYKLYAFQNNVMKLVYSTDDETHIDEDQKNALESGILVWKISVNLKENEEI